MLARPAFAADDFGLLDPFPARLRAQIAQSPFRFVIIGASGWMGQSVIAVLHHVLGAAFDHRVVCFGRAARSIDVPGVRRIRQAPLEEARRLSAMPTLVFNLAFLTKDKVADMSVDAYQQANRALTAQILPALAMMGAVRMFVASSGAAAFADDATAAADLRLYGALKRADEQIYADWARQDAPHRRVAICRIYSVSGPFINKVTTYALADLILQALAVLPPKVMSPPAVWRSYVSIAEILAHAVALLLDPDPDMAPVMAYDSGGEPIELGALAGLIARQFCLAPAARAMTTPPAHVYCGDHDAWRAMLGRYGLHHMPLADQISGTAAFLSRCETT